jgi:hypothetical protein
VLGVLLPACAFAAPMSSGEVKATLVLMEQFETAMCVRPEAAARGPNEKLSALDTVRGPISYFPES